jgi:hypothetical protein
MILRLAEPLYLLPCPWLPFPFSFSTYQFPLDIDETIVNLESVSMLQFAIWDWSEPIKAQVIAALLLKPAGDSGNYRRIGIAEVPTYGGLEKEGRRTRDVTII